MRQSFHFDRGQDPYAIHAVQQRVFAGFQFRQHAAGDYGLLREFSGAIKIKPADHDTVSVFHARNVCQENQRVSAAGHSTGRGHLVGVHVVVLAITAQRHA